MTATATCAFRAQLALRCASARRSTATSSRASRTRSLDCRAAVHDQGRDPRVAGRRAAARPPPRGAARGRPARLLDAAARPATPPTSRSPTPTSPAGPRSARAPTPRPGSRRPARGAHLQLRARSWPARCSTRGARIGATVIPVGSGNTERLVQGVPGASAPRRSAARRPTRSTSPTGAASATSSRASSACACSRSPASRAAERTRRGTRSRRRSAPPCARRWGSPTSRPRCGASARSRPACTSRGERLRPRRADRPRGRRAAAVRGRRRGRARLHVAAPRGDAGAALPQPRPRGGQREAVLVRARRAARALHRPHRRPADRARRQPLPDRAARGGRRVPPARRRPGADPPRARRRAPGRAAARARRAGRGAAAPTPSSPARSGQAIRTRLVVTTEVELVPYGTLPRASTRASWWTSRSRLRGDAEQRRVAVGALDHVVGRAVRAAAGRCACRSSPPAGGGRSSASVDCSGIGA